MKQNLKEHRDHGTLYIGKKEKNLQMYLVEKGNGTVVKQAKVLLNIYYEYCAANICRGKIREYKLNKVCYHYR